MRVHFLDFFLSQWRNLEQPAHDHQSFNKLLLFRGYTLYPKEPFRLLMIADKLLFQIFLECSKTSLYDNIYLAHMTEMANFTKLF